MERVAFKMKLFKGKEEEYKKRHDNIWPELSKLLKNSGIKDFSIFLDNDTHTLFAYLTIDHVNTLEALPDHPIQKKWWTYMKDLMDTNPDDSPVQITMQEVFHL